jgi:hypothetical protein
MSASAKASRWSSSRRGVQEEVALIDVTSVLNGLLSSPIAGRWTEDDVERRAGELAAAVDGRINWDQWAGEKWAMVGRGREPVAYLSVRAPLLFVDESVDSNRLPVRDLVVVTVPSMDSDVLTADLDTLLTFFDAERFTSEFDVAKFSFHDLHWETIL